MRGALAGLAGSDFHRRPSVTAMSVVGGEVGIVDRAGAMIRHALRSSAEPGVAFQVEPVAELHLAARAKRRQDRATVIITPSR